MVAIINLVSDKGRCGALALKGYKCDPAEINI